MLQNKKSLGQNWLKDRATLEEIAELAFEDVDLCLEIGPGLGTLTSSLLRRFPKVLAVEFDEKLAHNLPQSFPGKNLEVINQDFLQFDLQTINEPYVVAGNIPYYITTPIIEKLLTATKKPKRIVLLVQKEVAEKICPKESRLGNSSLSLFVDNYAEAHLGPVVPRELFTPPPKVDSEVLILIPRSTPKADTALLEFVHKSFANPRKKLSANLATFTGLAKTELEQTLTSLDLNPNARPADLSLEQYAMLAKSIKK
ncbi:ribosomal RNA small subunit methyltransferase A [Candidatus Saccharibacteria bacterium]|nr:ribosomal RNA small subunit methyltransferase A [Candidatus Saccharibacteria bacterium]MBR6123116.1 ribosomal RNA small subunit methyltransferase A [Candidatus Saccharibacteria bacterium]